jgi:SAM-dependent methyltransferase
MKPSGRDQFMDLVRESIERGSLVKMTLGKPSGRDPTLENVFVRPVVLKSGPRLAFVWRHATKDITKNHDAGAALVLLGSMIGEDFLDAHLFTATHNAQLETGLGGVSRLRLKADTKTAQVPTGNDRQKSHAIDPSAPWLRALGVIDGRGKPIPSMADKFRQIENFADILGHILKEIPFASDRRLRVFDMGCGKGYLTFATSAMLGEKGDVCGVEARADLVEFCNKTSVEQGFDGRLSFRLGTIADTDVDQADILIALHACDTATDDALAKGVSGGAALIVVAPCCQKEVRPQLVAPQVLRGALKHGIFEERQAEFVTDALRAQLLEWAGYRTRVIEFISTEHTAKNTMITAVKAKPAGDMATAERIRAFAAFYGINHQALATHLGFQLA